MFWWRKRNEGFEWRDYVRTTILVRREQRRQRLKDVKEAAAHQVKDAGRRGLDAGLAGARSAGSGTVSGLRGLGSAARSSAAALGRWGMETGRALGAWSAAAASSIWRNASALARRIGAPLGPVLDPVLAWARTPKAGIALKVVAALAGLGALYRTWAFGFDADAAIAAAIFALAGGLILLAALAAGVDPDRTRRVGEHDSLVARLRRHALTVPGAALALIAVVAIGTSAVVLLRHEEPAAAVASLASAPATTGALAPSADPWKLEGRAVAVTGDTLRIAGKIVRLDGVEAPETTQSCRRGTRAWPCGTAAKEALAALVRGRRITCEILGEDPDATRARCEAAGGDIAASLVRKGHVFATGGFWGSYTGVQSEAENEKVGLWAGEADRPQDFRDQRWEEAKRTAPEGCPIKGPVRAGARVYVLPWAPSYNGIRLRASRGERWFCSERDAEAAGWTRPARS